MRRNEDPITGRFGGDEQLFDVLNGLVFLDALTDQSPGDAVGAQEIVLRIGEDECCGGFIENHGALFL